MITQSEILVTFSFIAGSVLAFMGPWIIRRSKRTAIPKEKSGKILCCSFCGKNQTEVTKLIAGPEVFICDECIDLCVDILRTDQKHDLLRTDAEAMELFRELAEKGDIKVQIHLGQLYRNGENIPRDDSEALKWYRMAAEQGDAFAQGMVGQLYHEKDSAEANKWFRKSSLSYMDYEKERITHEDAGTLNHPG